MQNMKKVPASYLVDIPETVPSYCASFVLVVTILFCWFSNMQVILSWETSFMYFSYNSLRTNPVEVNKFLESKMNYTGKCTFCNNSFYKPPRIDKYLSYENDVVIFYTIGIFPIDRANGVFQNLRDHGCIAKIVCLLDTDAYQKYQAANEKYNYTKCGVTAIDFGKYVDFAHTGKLDRANIYQNKISVLTNFLQDYRMKINNYLVIDLTDTFVARDPFIVTRGDRTAGIFIENHFLRNEPETNLQCSKYLGMNVLKNFYWTRVVSGACSFGYPFEGMKFFDLVFYIMRSNENKKLMVDQPVFTYLHALNLFSDYNSRTIVYNYTFGYSQPNLERMDGDNLGNLYFHKTNLKPVIIHHTYGLHFLQRQYSYCT